MAFKTVQLVDEFVKNSREQIHVSVGTGPNGLPLVSFWGFYRDIETGEHKPGRAGLSFGIDKLPRFAKSVEKAQRVVENLRAAGVLPPAEPGGREEQAA